MWLKAAISDGEIDALHRAAMAACSNDTRYPAWHGSHHAGRGQCLNMARWLVDRLGGHVGLKHGHYTWLSPDKAYTIDLTGHHQSGWTYEPNDGYRALPLEGNDRSAKFAKRADRLFESLDSLLRLSLDYAGDAYPAEEPQAADDSDRFNDSWNDPESYWHDEVDPHKPEGVYQFVWANGALEVSPNHSHAELSEHAGIDPAQHQGPFAAGHVTVASGRATWEVQANVNLHAFFKILKDATKSYGWQWGGMTDPNGQPINDQFAPKRSVTQLNYVLADDHLFLGRTSTADLALRTDPQRVLTGTLRIFDKRAFVAPVHPEALAQLFDWATDSGLTLYAGNDNVIKTIPDLQEKNVYSPNPLAPDNPVEQNAPDERLPSGLYSCPTCKQLFPDWREYSKHRREGNCAEWANPDHMDNGDRGLPEPDPGLYGDGAHYTEMRQEPGITTGSVTGASYDLHPGPCEHCGYPELREHRSPGWSYLQCVSCGMASHQRPGDAAAANDPLKPVDPWMDNEPGSLSLPPNWSKIVVLPARTWKEAARVDGFTRYATAFEYADDEHRFYVAYRNGDPLGYAAVKPDGYLHMMHAAVDNQGVATAIYAHLIKEYDSLYSGAMHEKTVSLMKRAGWVQVDRQKWKWSKGQAPTDMLEAPLPFIYDVDKDKIFVGHPGARTSDIPGKFTPGGIVEGMYEPGGKVIIRSLTSVPYTTHHLIQLWYYTHPQLEVKSVHLQDDAGKDTRLAATEITLLSVMDPAADTAARALRGAGGRVYAVGGAVRDVILGHEPNDIDLLVAGLDGKRATAALRKHGSVITTGKDFAVMRFNYAGRDVEIALPRSDRSTGPGHTDFEVAADPSLPIEEDLRRRDFTANALACELGTGHLIDPFGGYADIEAGVLRTITTHSLSDDPLRLMRGLVAHARYGFTPEDATRLQMADNAGGLESLPGERIQWELTKIMASKDPTAAIRLAHEVGALKYILPEVEACMGYDQNNPHHELDLGDHLLKVLERTAAKTADPDLRLAALLHDIGKPGSAWQDPETGRSHFYAKHLDGRVLGADHETLGAELARERLNALRYPNDRIARITALISHHMYAGFTTTTGARRFLARVGNHADDLFLLRWADQGGKDVQPHQAEDKAWDVSRNRRLVSKVREAGEAFDRTGLAINGNDLIKAGHSPGPRFSAILSQLTQQVIDDPSLNDRATLLRHAAELDTTQESHDPIRRHPQEGQSAQAQAEAIQLRGARQGERRQASPGDADPQVGLPADPQFPDLDDAVEAHDAALEAAGQPYAELRDPAGLESALGRAENHWYYSDPAVPASERLMQSAAMMGHGVAQRQAFEDGNKRTAYWLMHGFLHNHGMGHVMPGDDPETANAIVGWGEHTHGPEHLVDLWRQRHEAAQ